MTRLRTLLGALAAAICLIGGIEGAATARPVQPTTGAQWSTHVPATRPARAGVGIPPVGHLFVVNIENKGFDRTWGATSKAPYLATTLRSKGVLLTNYYGTAHNSQPNYIAQISGQGPNRKMQSDCQIFAPFKTTGTAVPGQFVGTGCVFPKSVPQLPSQLTAAGRTWKAYMEDMGTPCRHPALGATDQTQHAQVGDMYAVRHNPFVYFRAIIDAPVCTKRVVDLSALTRDLASITTTANYTYITPNLCHDGHDAPCVDGQPGGLASVDAWMKVWIPRILDSAAFKKDGALVITADEADSPKTDASACCGAGPAPNAALPGLTGLGGGRVGALVISRFVTPGTTTTRPYNHYSLLASTEDLFGLPYLGYAAQAGLPRFGTDVWNGSW
jgi:hypothetical protein